MRNFKNRFRWLGLLALLMAILACNASTVDKEAVGEVPVEQVDSAESTSTPAAKPTTPAESDSDPVAAPPTNDNSSLDNAQRQELAAGTVHIVMLKEDGKNDYYIFGYGSGTIISEDGLILTNAHVASPADIGFPEDQPDALAIEMIAREDEPPVATYMAEVVVVDGSLDLAVIQIVSLLDGTAVKPADLDLPVVALGDSDDIHLGDSLNIFGFPGIGGDTITFTRGVVSGFSSGERVGNRAWIKTDSTIAGGNSGGLGADSQGRIVGIPTRGGSGGDNDLADCRVVQDTNGDGRLTDADTCIPIGGFINALRPINLAKPLIHAAQTDSAYVSPYEVAVSGGEQLVFKGWSDGYDDNGCVTTKVKSYSEGANQITAVFGYAGMVDGSEIGYTWLLDGDTVTEGRWTWDAGSDGKCFPFWLEGAADSDSLDAGAYSLLVYAGDGLPLVASAETRVGSAATKEVPASNLIRVGGKITDAGSGKAIQGAVVFVLMPGVSVDDWLDNPTAEQVYSFAETDRLGFYSLPDGLAVDVRYEAAVSADGWLEETGFLEFSAEEGAEATVDVQLSR